MLIQRLNFEKNMFFKVFDNCKNMVLNIISILIFGVFLATDNVITALPTLILIVVSVID